MKKTERIAQLEDRVDLLLDIVQGLLTQKDVKLVWVEDYDRMAQETEDARDIAAADAAWAEQIEEG